MHRKVMWLLPALVLVASLSGCASDAEPGVATAQSGPPAAGQSAGTDAVARYVDSMRAYVKCMREAGFDLPDPDPKGYVDHTSVGPQKASQAFTDASQRCSPLRLPMPKELQQPPSLSPQQIAWARAYAKCMRENGVPDFPDPGPNGLYDENHRRSQGTTEQEAAALFRTGQICEPVRQGKPTTTPDPNRTGQG